MTPRHVVNCSTFKLPYDSMEVHTNTITIEAFVHGKNSSAKLMTTGGLLTTLLADYLRLFLTKRSLNYRLTSPRATSAGCQSWLR